MYTKEQIKNDLYNLGIRSGDMILMHSSYKSLGKIEGGAKTFFEAFVELLGTDGTLVVPSLSFDTVTRENPVFDIKSTPSCVGYLAEFFRTKVAGVVRSLHATHSCCALGKYAKEITSNHEKDITPVGKNSPFAKLPEYNGKILMLGCGTRCNTSMHGVEEITEPPYCIDRKNMLTYTLKYGDNIITVNSYPHDFATQSGAHYIQRYDRIVDLLKEDEFCTGKVLDASCCLMDAKAVWKKGNEMLTCDPMFFVDYPQTND